MRLRAAAGVPIRTIETPPYGPAGLIAPTGAAAPQQQQVANRRPLLIIAAIIGAVLILLLVRALVTPQSTTTQDRPDTSSAGPVESYEPSEEPTDGATTESPSESSTPPTLLPDGATVCPVTFEADEDAVFQHSARGNDVTTCPFAEKVRQAYLKKAGDGSPATVRAHSPVTKKNYIMECSGAPPMRCVGGRNALVLLY